MHAARDPARGGGQGAGWALVETSVTGAVSPRPTEADAVPAGAAVGARASGVRGLAVLVRVSHAHTPRTRACAHVPRPAGHPRSAVSQSPGSELRALLRSLNPQFVLPSEKPAFGGLQWGSAQALQWLQVCRTRAQAGGGPRSFR